MASWASFVNTVPLKSSRYGLSSLTSCPRKRKRVSAAPFPARMQAQADESTASTTTVPTTFTWAVGQSSRDGVLDAVAEAITRASPTLSRAGRTATVVFIFVRSTFSSSPGNDLRRVASIAKKALAMRRVLGKETIICGCTTSHYTNEEEDPSASVALVHFPEGTALSTFAVQNEDSLDLDWKQNQWHDFVGMPLATTEAAQMNILLLQHPDFDAMPELLSSLDFAYPGVRKLGASAGRSNPMHETYLFDTDGPVISGAIGLAFASPDVQVDVTVAQGARGVGPLLEVLEVRDGNEVTKVKEVNTPGVSVGPPMVLLDMWGKTDYISKEDREHARKYLLFGVEVPKVVDLAVSSTTKESESTKEEIPEAQKPIDMVIRKVVGFNEVTKSLGIEGEDVRLGSRVQFQIRDEEAARAELVSLFNKLMLEGSSKAMDGMSLMGNLLMVDSERGESLYGNVVADLDRAMYTERFPVPLALLTSERQIGPLPSGGLLGTAGNTFVLSASALYVSFYGRTGVPSDQTDDPSSRIDQE